MKISGCTFIRNGEQLGYPFVQSIKSILPICDEFIVNVGYSDDNTLAIVKAIKDKKIKIIETQWNDKMQVKGFTYGQQKMIAQYSCSGDWVFYLEGDEVVHEQDLVTIKRAAKKHLKDMRVEALLFDYIHFFGNTNTYLESPHWFRRTPRIIRNNLRSFAPDGLFWTVLDKNNKKARYPKAAHTNAKIYHYGYVKTQQQQREKFNQVRRYWDKNHQSFKSDFSYVNTDTYFLREFKGSHPQVMQSLLSKETGILQTNPDYKLTWNDRRYRTELRLEKWFGLDFSRKHYKLIR